MNFRRHFSSYDVIDDDEEFDEQIDETTPIKIKIRKGGKEGKSPVSFHNKHLFDLLPANCHLFFP